jgi:hypothetical protein
MDTIDTHLHDKTELDMKKSFESMSVNVKEKFSKILIVFLPLWIGLDVNMKHFWMNTFF